MAQVDRLAELDFSQQDTLILGGSRGFGRALGIDLKRQRVRNLALGTSDLKSLHYRDAMTAFNTAGVDTEGVIPFEANLLNTQQVEESINNLPFRPKHIFMLPAGGMNPWALKFNQYVARLQSIEHHPERYEEGAREKVLGDLHEQYDIWLPQNLEEAVQMNLLAPVRTLETLAKRFKEDGFTFTYLDSLFGDEGRGPRYYTNVLTKHAFDIWLAQNARSYARRKIDTARIIAPAILGTDIGDFLVGEVSEVEDPEVAEKLTDTAVEPEDIFGPIYEFMSMSREERAADGIPFERYVIKYKGRVFVERTFPGGLRIDPSKYLL